VEGGEEADRHRYFDVFFDIDVETIEIVLSEQGEEGLVVSAELVRYDYGDK
jgi:hypothetical protein